MGTQDASIQTFQSLEELPSPRPLPQVAQQVIAACESPDVDAKNLSEIIQCDPAISVRLLQASNSSMYGFSGEIRSIDHAIVALGLRVVKDLAVSFAASAMFNEGENVDARQRLWKHSLACGVVASHLAPLAQVNPSEAFLAGIVHDVGKLLLLDTLEDRYLDCIKDASHDTIVDVETKTFGVNHQEAGGRCGDEWGLPIEITDAIENHHCPEDAATSVELAGVIHAANCLVKNWNLDGSGEQELDVAAALERADVGVGEGELEEIQQVSVDQVESLKAVCG